MFSVFEVLLCICFIVNRCTYTHVVVKNYTPLMCILTWSSNVYKIIQQKPSICLFSRTGNDRSGTLSVSNEPVAEWRYYCTSCNMHTRVCCILPMHSYNGRSQPIVCAPVTLLNTVLWRDTRSLEWCWLC